MALNVFPPHSHYANAAESSNSTPVTVTRGKVTIIWFSLYSCIHKNRLLKLLPLKEFWLHSLTAIKTRYKQEILG